MRRLFLSVLFVLIFGNAPVHASPVAAPLSIEKLNDKAQIVVKVTALSTDKAEPKKLFDGRFSGPVDAVTRFSIVSVLKGDLKTKDDFYFHHRSSAKNYPLIIATGLTSTGTIYDFSPGHSYLLWATRIENQWCSIELTGAAFAFPSLGALLTPDDTPVAGDIKQIVWQQTTALLESKNKSDVMTGIDNLSHMMQRQGRHDVAHSSDFNNDDVAAALKPLLKSDDPKIAEFATIALKPAPEPENITGASTDFKN